MKTELLIDVGPHLPGGPANRVAIDVHLPARPAADAVLFFCLPGGGVARGYFDLDGGPGTRFSFAREMNAAGHVVVAVDPVGVGGSTRPEDGFTLTTEVEAQLIHRAFERLRTMTVGGIDLGTLRLVGGGHSAGAVIAVVQQALYRDFDAMILFCFGTGGLREQLTPEQLASLDEPDGGRSRIVEFARDRSGGQAYVEPPVRYDDTPASRALRAVHDRVVMAVGVHAMTPGSVRQELGGVDVPVFLAVGDRDITGPPHLLASDYRACPDFTLIVLPTSGHHVFVAPTAPAMYRRVVNWIEGLPSATG
ncbi:alpha/beta fold hydrolase [Flavisphingomonas formosensis]|uniref:alpha/beta fold hydrolase n=1 Tax=Flavisphingomonas formosensis TaxID=861534 RepID=UPI0012FC835A|nr:alpha/beta fold hydrolase [Sphingomonas formosensis]